MKSFKELMEKAGDTAVFTLGRFNPPTTGHEKLIKKMDSVAKKNSAPMYVFPTHSTESSIHEEDVQKVCKEYTDI